MKTVKVKVTHDNIEKGNSNPDGCPVALALNRVTRRKVTAGIVWICFANGQYVETPQVVRDFIKNYDRHRLVKPFSFEISY